MVDIPEPILYRFKIEYINDNIDIFFANGLTRKFNNIVSIKDSSVHRGGVGFIHQGYHITYVKHWETKDIQGLKLFEERTFNNLYNTLNFDKIMSECEMKTTEITEPSLKVKAQTKCSNH